MNTIILAALAAATLGVDYPDLDAQLEADLAVCQAAMLAEVPEERVEQHVRERGFTTERADRLRVTCVVYWRGLADGPKVARAKGYIK